MAHLILVTANNLSGVIDSRWVAGNYLIQIGELAGRRFPEKGDIGGSDDLTEIVDP